MENTDTMEKKKTIPPPKRRKVESKSEGNVPAKVPIDTPKMTFSTTLIPVTPVVSIKDPKIQQAKKNAVTQAQQEGWLGNFRSFDSPFGNYLVPVIPTHADLSG